MNNEISKVIGGVQWGDQKRSISMQFQFISGCDTGEKFDPVTQIYLRALQELGYGKHRRRNRRRVWIDSAQRNEEVKHDAS